MVSASESTFHSDMKSLLQSEKFSDITILVKLLLFVIFQIGDLSLKLHRFVLGTVSGKFTEISHNLSNELRLQEENVSLFLALIEFIYTANVSIEKSKLPSFLMIISKYGVEVEDLEKSESTNRRKKSTIYLTVEDVLLFSKTWLQNRMKTLWESHEYSDITFVVEGTHDHVF